MATYPFVAVQCIYLEGGESKPRTLGEVAREECVVGRQLQIVWIHLQGQLKVQIQISENHLI